MNPDLPTTRFIWEVNDSVSNNLPKKRYVADEISNLNPNKYDLNFDIECIDELVFPEFSYEAEYGKLNAVRMQIAAKNGDRNLLMHLFRCSNRNDEMIVRMPYLISGLVYQSILQKKYQSIAMAMHNGILTEDDLLEIRNSARQSQLLFQQRFINFYCGEVVLFPVNGDIEMAFALVREDILFKRQNTKWQNAFLKYAPFNPVLLLVNVWLKNEDLLIYRKWDNFFTAASECGADFIQLKSRLNWPKNDDVKNYGIFDRGNFPAFGATIKVFQAGYDRMQLLQLVCEIELFKLRNGRLPRDLDELQLPELPLDTFWHRPYIYKIGSWPVPEQNFIFDGYRIYSVGGNGIDDDGYKDNGSRDDIGLTVAAIRMMPAMNHGQAKSETAAEAQN